jgi:hypothetical protein
LTGTAKFFAFVLVAGIFTAGVSLASAQSSSSPAGNVDITKTINGPGIHSIPDNFTAQVRNARSWEYGPFVNGGFGAGNRSQYKFLSAGFQLGKPVTPVFHAGALSGQLELSGNIMPLWQAYTPAAHNEDFTCTNTTTGLPYTCSLVVGGGNYYGVSLTPVILRWNFLTKSKRIQPWAQAAGGLVYTTHKFPPSFQSTQTLNGKIVQLDGGTCVWNFTPQGGGGIHYFTSAKRSIDLGVNAVHISSASLGDRNPGVNASFQIQLGYTFWK